MTATPPTSSPPPALAGRALPILLFRLRQIPPADPSLPDLLQATLHTLAIARLHRSSSPHVHSTLPLKLLLTLTSTASAPLQPLLGVSTVLDAILAYPTYPTQLKSLINTALTIDPNLTERIRNDVLPPLIERLRLSPPPTTAEVGVVSYTLLSLCRAHDELSALLLSEADSILPAVRVAYAKLSSGAGSPEKEEVMRVKEEVLLLHKSLGDALGGERGGTSSSARDRLWRLVSEPASAQEGMETLSADLYALEKGDIAGVETLRALQDSSARSNPRLAPLLPLFPSIPPRLLLQALNHPTFSPSSSSASYEAQAALLIDAIFSGGEGIPAELAELREEVRLMSAQQGMLGSNGIAAPGASIAGTMQRGGPRVNVKESKRIERRNIFDDEELDFSRLRLGKDDSNLPSLGTAIPDHLRASILRLVETQKEEAEAQARAIAEAREGAYVPQRETLGDWDIDDGEEGEAGGKAEKARGGIEGDDSGAEETVGENIVKRYATTGTANSSLASGSHIDVQSTLELAYLADARVFDRDANNRRSLARRQLREETGMDDGQLEGWRVMLERNPHKEALLARHTLVPSRPRTHGPSEAGKQGTNPSKGQGGHQGGRSGGGGGGKGRGQNKGSRGHQNAARTRGHDRKMTKMGGP